MRKIRLSDKDIEFFDLEVSPAEFVFFQKHKDAFRCMWKEQGKDFWTKFTITFRSFTVKHGVIKQMSCDARAPKFENMVDEAFIYIHEQFVDGKESIARRFIEDTAKLAQNHDKFPHLDSKSFSKDPFYSKDTRDLFRGFFGNPDQKSSYIKVYVLSPIYLRFGGSVCRCLRRWMDAPPHDCKDDSYWIPPSLQSKEEEKSRQKVIMCTKCLDACGTMYSLEIFCGLRDGPKFLDYWRLGDPRFNDSKNPLFDPHADRDADWRDGLMVEDFQDFVHYSKFKYGQEEDKCSDCMELDGKNSSNVSQKNENVETEKKKKKKKKNKEKTGEIGSKGDVDEVQKLVDHINGKSTLDVMPVNTKAGASAEAEASGITENMLSQASGENKTKRKRRGVFSNKARVTDGFKPSILSEELSTGEVVGGFKVIKIEDERTGAKEIKIKVRALKAGDDNDIDMMPTTPQMLRSAVKQPLAAELLRKRIKNMPAKLEWWEGSGWCAVVVNYEEEEKHVTACPTNFTLKVSGHEENTIKSVMLKLLLYVSGRKKRPCPGWVMDDDDVITCILPDETTDQDGLTICIQRGFRFQDGLSEEEKETIMMPSDIDAKLTVLFALDGGLAEAVAKGPYGRYNLKRLIERISGRCLSESDNKKLLTKKLKEKGKILEDESTEGDDKFDDKCEMWKQIVNEPKSFEMLIQVNARRVEELEELGLRPVDLDLVYSSEDKRNTTIPLQKMCHKCDQAVYYCNCFDRSIYNELLQCNCRKCKVNLQTEQKTLKKLSPEKASAKEIPDKKAVKESPDRKAVKGNSDKKAVKEIPDKKAVKESPDKMIVKGNSDKKAIKEIDDKKAVKESPDKKAVQESSDKNTGKLGPDKKTVKESSDKKPIKEISDKMAVKESPGKDAEVCPNRVEECTGKKNVEVSPDKKAVKESHKDRKGKKKSKTFLVADIQITHREKNGETDKWTVKENQDVKVTEIQDDEKDFLAYLASKKEKSTPVGDRFADVKIDFPPDLRKMVSEKFKENFVHIDGTPIENPEEEFEKALHLLSNKLDVEAEEKVEAEGDDLGIVAINTALKEKAEGTVDVSSEQGSKDKEVTDSKEQKDLGDVLDFILKSKNKVPEIDIKKEVKGKETVDTPKEKGKEEIKTFGPESLLSNTKALEEIQDKLIESQDADMARVALMGGIGQPITSQSSFKHKLKNCAYCGKTEPAPRTFKKCQKCKQEGIKSARYYCGRVCQVEDWTAKHRKEHRENTLV